MQFDHYGLMCLWVDAGGPPAYADQMAATALRESGGETDKNNAGLNSDGSIDYNAWQINSVHRSWIGERKWKKIVAGDPATGAWAAVQVFKRQGPGAWVALTSGSGKTPPSRSEARRYLSKKMGAGYKFAVSPGIGPIPPGALDLLGKGADALGDVGIPGVGDVASAIRNLATAMEAIGRFFVELLRKIADPQTWLDAFKVWGGIILLWMGLKRVLEVST